MTKVKVQWLEDVGISSEVIEYAGIEKTYNGIKYHVEYPPRIDMDDDSVVYDRIFRTRLDPAWREEKNAERKEAGEKPLPKTFNPRKADLPDGQNKELPVLYIWNFKSLQHSIKANGGILYLVEGDKDTWTMHSIGITNSAGILSTSAKISSLLVPVLQALGASHVRLIPDADDAGWGLAQKLSDVLQANNFSFGVYHLGTHHPLHMDESEPLVIKDINDLHVGFDCEKEATHKYIIDLRKMQLASQKQRDYAKNGEYFQQELYELIESRLGVEGYRETRSELSNHVACPNPNANHTNDDTDPKFAWDRKHKIGICQKCGETWLTVEICGFLGIDWKPYVNRGKEKDAPPSIKTPDNKIPSKSTGNLEIPNANTSTLNMPGSFLEKIAPRVEHLKTLPDESLVHFFDDALDMYDLRLKGAIPAPYPAIKNPISLLHRLGGAGKAIPRPFMWGVLGISGGFKCQSGNTRINTVDGLVRIDSLAFDNGEAINPLQTEILTPHGVKETSHFHDTGVAPTKLAKTRYGYDTQATYNHPLQVLREDGTHQWVRMDELKEGDYLCINRQNAMFGNHVSLPSPRPKNHSREKDISIPETLTEDLSYIFGTLVGDGGLTQRNSIRFTTADEELVTGFAKWADDMDVEMYNDKVKYQYAIHSVRLHDWLNEIGLCHPSYEKTVPEAIFRSPKPMVKAFIQGLFDTDGHVGSYDKFKVVLNTASEQLAKDLHLLLLQFGIVSKRFFVPNKKRGAWRVIMRGHDAVTYMQEIGFRLSRKQSVIADAPRIHNTNTDLVPYLPEADVTRLPRNRGERGKYRRRLCNHYTGTVKTRFSHDALENYRELYPEFHEILDSHFFYDPIVSIEEGGDEHCYDVTVPDGQAFIANGIVSHNTTLMSWMVNQLAFEGYNVIVWTPEWDTKSNADRVVQQFGGLKMGEMNLLERYYSERTMIAQGAMANDDPALFGEIPDEDRLVDTELAIQNIRSAFSGKVGYLRSYSADAYDLVAQLFRVHAIMTEMKRQPEVFILDYTQMVDSPEGEFRWRTKDTIKIVKQATWKLGLATIMASQVRKDDTESVIKNAQLLTSLAGLDFHDHQFNFFTTVNPRGITVMPDGRRLQEVKLAVTKHSIGAKAFTEDTAPSFYVDLDRMLILEHPNDDLPVAAVPLNDPDHSANQHRDFGDNPTGYAKVVNQARYNEPDYDAPEDIDFIGFD